ncbi:Tn3 family transposase [Clostridium sp. SHJSY1]|uniref:Tn3 family transposase n=1 Tax=Clostridium sp. SHJSY1 TaxID=2942483 RepID=UPI00287658A3|nr:Tn3 family transposase [Clostridium sp. SHJSY1]MDS0527825.1 Tn3 family transposase [Clostridium sp. SHJSY1]
MKANEILTSIFSKISKEDLKSAIRTVDNLTKPADQKVAYDELFKNYITVRKFLPKLLSIIKFQATPTGQHVLSAWEYLRENEARKKKAINAPLDGITPTWRNVIIKNGTNKIYYCAYTFCMLERMLEALKNHDIYVEISERYRDPRAHLLQDSAWDAVKPHVLRTLDWSSSAEKSLTPITEELDKAYKKTVKNWNDNPFVRIEPFAGYERLVITPLDRLDESISLKRLKKRTQARMPHIDLPELLLEVNRWTGFLEAFTHISQVGSRVNDLAISMCAVLISHACNIGFKPVVQPGIPPLEYDRLTWVDQNYFRTETLTEANNALVKYHSNLKLPKSWGGGEVASADGLRFITHDKAVNSGSNPKYLGIGRGVTYYNFTSDQFSGFYGIVIPGTIRDSLYLLEGILEQQTVLNPREIMTDTAGYSDIVFGLFGLLGYQFSPRIADIGKSKFWRIDSEADYGVLNTLSKNKIRIDIIHRNWDDMLRVTGSLKLGKINPTQLIQTLQRNGKPTMLGKAIGEFGRIYKTQYLLSYLDDKSYRRRILTQLNRGESRHSLARAVYYGKKGELHQTYREGQEDQLGALGLVVNAIVVWNTRYMELSIDNIKHTNTEIEEKDIERLSPLGFDHINIMGKYSFNLSKEVEQGRLRQLIITKNIDEEP